MRGSCTFLISLTLALPAQAQPQPQPVSGNQWLAACNDKGAGQIVCLMYARGVADTLGLWQNLAPNTAPACIPPEVTATQLKDVGQQYMTIHANERHYAVAPLLMTAFKQEWPCSGQQP
jgi:hypothetical protein